MKISDLVMLAVKNLKGRWVALPFIGYTIAAFCLCFAGAIMTTVQGEKAQPYELVLSAQGNANITDSTIADILKISDVKSATPILQLPVTIRTGKYTAQLTLTGMNAGYLDGVYAQGSVFPAESVMPYILLNKVVQKQFTEDPPDVSRKNTDIIEADMGENKPPDANAEIPEIDWLNTSYSLSLGEESRSVTSKVCGILSDGDAEDAESVAYVSLPVAKELLQKNGQSTDTKTAWVSITNIGCADAVSRQIAALGLDVTNSNEQKQAAWDVEMKEMAYLIILAVFLLICSAVLMTAWRKISLLKYRQAWNMLRWMGLREGDLRRLFSIQNVVVTGLAAALGIIVAACLPSFLSTDGAVKSSFSLSIPFEAMVVCSVICISFGQLAVWEAGKSRLR